MLKIGPSWNQEYLKELSQEQLDFLKDLQNDTLQATPIEDVIADKHISEGINWAKLCNVHNISREELDRFCVRDFFGRQGTTIDPNDAYRFKKQMEEELYYSIRYNPEEHHDKLMKYIANVMINNSNLTISPFIYYGDYDLLRTSDETYLFCDPNLRNKLLADAKLYAERWLDRNEKELESLIASTAGRILFTPETFEHDLAHTIHVDYSPDTDTEVQKHRKAAAKKSESAYKLIKDLR